MESKIIKFEKNYMEIVKVDNHNEIIVNDNFEKELNEIFSSIDKNCIIYKSDFYEGFIAAEKLNDKIIFCDSSSQIINLM
jgi:guanylate kinase